MTEGTAPESAISQREGDAPTANGLPMADSTRHRPSRSGLAGDPIAVAVTTGPIVRIALRDVVTAILVCLRAVFILAARHRGRGNAQADADDGHRDDETTKKHETSNP